MTMFTVLPHSSDDDDDNEEDVEDNDDDKVLGELEKTCIKAPKPN